MSADAVIVPAGKGSNDAFKALGFSVFMVRANVGLAQLEVVERSKRLIETYRAWREHPNGNISEVLRDLASVDDAIEKLRQAEEK